MSTKEETIVEQVDMNLDDILGLPGAENVMLPQSEPKKQEKTNILEKEKSATAFLGQPDEDEDEDEVNIPEARVKEKLNKILDEDIREDEEEEETVVAEKKSNPAAGVFKRLIDKQILYELEDEKSIDEYDEADFEELVELNLQEMRNDLSQQFFESLPQEFLIARKYFEDGNTDLKPLFKILSNVEETRSLDPSVEDDAEIIVRKHLTNTRYGTPEEIEEEIEKLKDRDEIGDKARKFKPKLDAAEQQLIAEKLAKQEQIKKQQQVAAQAYMTNVFETLKPGEIGGVKMDKKTQSMLYYGLTEPSYPSVSGRPTNLLGHLLEKYQYVEPNHGLVAEALWLLADPKGYKKKMLEMGQTIASAETAKKLKTEQSMKTSTSPVVEKEERTTKRIKGNNNNFFKRF